MKKKSKRMSRFNLNSILSWINSHMSDYPRAISVFRFFFNLITITKVTIFVFFVSLCLLFFVSRFWVIIFLLVFTFFLLYNKKYKVIFFLWGSFLFIWYLVFIACLVGYEGSLLIRPDIFGGYYIEEYKDTYSETVRLCFFINDKYSYCSSIDSSLHSSFNFDLGRFCMETFFLLCWISEVLDVTIYVPSLLKGILALFKFICGVWGGKGGPSA